MRTRVIELKVKKGSKERLFGGRFKMSKRRGERKRYSGKREEGRRDESQKQRISKEKWNGINLAGTNA